MHHSFDEFTVQSGQEISDLCQSWTLGNGEIYEFYCTNNRELEELEKVRQLELEKK